MRKLGQPPPLPPLLLFDVARIMRNEVPRRGEEERSLSAKAERRNREAFSPPLSSLLLFGGGEDTKSAPAGMNGLFILLSSVGLAGHHYHHQHSRSRTTAIV